MRASRYRASLAVWALLIVYASLYPLLPLRSPSAESVVAFFLKPRYVVASDIALNVIAYMPLGTLACLYLRRAGESWAAILRATALGAALSFLMEACQLFIPGRVASIYDVAANAGGTFVGALAFADPVYSMLTRPLGALRERVVIEDVWGDAGLVLLGLWFLAQLNPALPFFGAGTIGAEGGSDLAALQSAAVALGICGFGLFVSALVKGDQGSLRITLALLSIALWLKFAASSVMLQPNFSAEWVNTGRVAGLAAGLLAFIPLRRMPRLGRIYLGFLLILAGALFAKIFGAYSPLEELLRLFRWPYGQLANFATLTQFLQELWPFAAVGYLVALFFRARRSSAARMEP